MFYSNKKFTFLHQYFHIVYETTQLKCNKKPFVSVANSSIGQRGYKIKCSLNTFNYLSLEFEQRISQKYFTHQASLCTASEFAPRGAGIIVLNA